MLKIELVIQYITYDIKCCRDYLDSLCEHERRILNNMISDKMAAEIIKKMRFEREYNNLKHQNKSKKLNTFFDHPGAIFFINQGTTSDTKKLKEYREYLESKAEYVSKTTLYIFEPMKDSKFTPARFLESKKFLNDENLFKKATLENAKLIHIDGEDFDCIIVK